MAFATSTAYRPSLLLPPRQSPSPSRALLCTPSTAAVSFRGAAINATSLSAAAPRRRAVTIVCGKVTPTNITNLCYSRRNMMRASALAALLLSVSSTSPPPARAADESSVAQVSKGSAAPNFTLRDQDGRAVSLSKFKGKPVVVYFYPADETPGCTKQACAFRDSYENDEGNKVRKEWGVPSDLFGTLPGRQTYVLDKNGVVQYIYNNQFQPEKHIGETLKILESL
uniref:thioredoxin-dependent peroxiredoxin n=1 Tax=Leersia perrieri TaxID=77586 RepID=A0A0D9WMX0_9ORYZ